MEVLSVASEVFPLVKTGGLADVVGALPAALAGHGVHVRTMVPGYPAVMERLGKSAVVCRFRDLLGETGRLLAATVDGLDLLVLDLPALFDRPGNPYGMPGGEDFPDNWKRFAVFSKAAAEVAGGAIAGWRPVLVHAHDWQAAMTPVYMRHSRKSAAVPSVMTVHNLAFQGQFSAAFFGQLDLPASAFQVDGIEYYGDIGYLKGGLQTASVITTVSPTYAEEIATPEFGMGLDGLVRARADSVHGIVNGIDTAIWDPQTDASLPAAFKASSLADRQKNRAAVLDAFALTDSGGPLFVVISRLTWQKGMDLLIPVVNDIAAGGGMLAVLGSGDAALEDGLKAAAARHPGRIGVRLGYDEPLSHLMQGGGDAIVIPSRFEPCGLTQLYGLRYGCVPIVARTGGLADTVIDANEAALSAGVATGFQFAPITVDALRHALRRSFDAFADRKVWTRLQRQGMKADVSWDRSGKRYADLYRALIHKG